MSKIIRRFLVALAELGLGLFTQIALAKPIVLYSPPNITTQTHDQTFRDLQAGILFSDYINGGGTYNSGTDQVFVRYANNIQQEFTVAFENGQYVLSGGTMGWWAIPTWVDFYSPSFGGACTGAAPTLQETGYWVSYEVCINGSCNQGVTWIHTGWRVYPEAIQNECEGLA